MPTFNDSVKQIGKSDATSKTTVSLVNVRAMNFIRSLLGVNIKMTLMIKNSLLNKCFFSVRR